MPSEEPRSKPVRFTLDSHAIIKRRADRLSDIRRQPKSSIPAYVMEASEFFEKWRDVVAKLEDK